MSNAPFLPYVSLIFLGWTAAVYHALPHLTREDIYFGITVHPAFRGQPAGQRALRLYRIRVWAHSIIAVAAAAFGAQTGRVWLYFAAAMWQGIGASRAYLASRRLVQPYAAAPSTLREATIGPRTPQTLPGGVVGQFGPFALLAAATGYVAWDWHDVPQRWPTHWNFMGRADEWVTRSLATAYRPAIIGALFCALLAGTRCAILHGSAVPTTGHRDAGTRRANLLRMLVGEYAFAGMCSWSTIAPPLFRGAGAPQVLGVLVVGTIGIGVMAAITIRSAAAASSAGCVGSRGVGDRTRDSAWKLGRIYYERSDPAVFVPKRFGIGYTLNVANPWAWLAAIVMFTSWVGILFITLTLGDVR